MARARRSPEVDLQLMESYLWEIQMIDDDNNISTDFVIADDDQDARHVFKEYARHNERYDVKIVSMKRMYAVWCMR